MPRLYANEAIKKNDLLDTDVFPVSRPADDYGLTYAELKNAMYSLFIGEIKSYPNKITDTEFLSHHMECNGQILKQSDYPVLYSRIGDLYKTDDVTEGSFALPDLRGYFLRGATDDVAVGTTQEDAMQPITGSFDVRNTSAGNPLTFSSSGFITTIKNGGSSTNASANFDAEQNQAGKMTFDSSKQVRTADETRPKNYSIIYYIVVK